MKPLSRRKTRVKPAHYHWQLLVERLEQKLIFPFACARCKCLALDPIGYDQKGQWLCEDCADGEPFPQ